MLFALIIGLILLYFIIILVTKFLKIIGVKTKSSTSSNYNNYYSRGQKKVKRKYKDEADKVADKSEE